MSVDLNVSNFDQFTTETSGLALVDFWAPWCGPCKVMSPIVDELSKEMSGVSVGKLNVDENVELATRYNVLSIPTFMIFKGGQVVDQFAGSMSKQVLKERIEKQQG